MTITNDTKELFAIKNLALTSFRSILSELVKPEHRLSLERLQLLSIALKINAPMNQGENFHNLELLKYAKGNENFVELSAKLGSKPTAELCIKYFLRGQRKFFRFEEPSLPKLEEITVQEEDFKKNIKNLNDEAQVFYDQDLAKLYGHQKLKIANHLIWDWALDELFTALDNTKTPLNIVATFHQAIEQGASLTKSFSKQENSVLLILKADHRPALLVELNY